MILNLTKEEKVEDMEYYFIRRKLYSLRIQKITDIAITKQIPDT